VLLCVCFNPMEVKIKRGSFKATSFE